MKKNGELQYPHTISGFQFFMKLMAVIGRIPFMAYHGLKGIKAISGNRKISWGSLLRISRADILITRR